VTGGGIADTPALSFAVRPAGNRTFDVRRSADNRKRSLHPRSRPAARWRGLAMMQRQNAPGYEEDFVAWLEDQARHARRGEIDALDLDNIAEELDGMARSDRREIRNRLTVLLAHLLKSSARPGRPSASWLGTIAEQRDQIAILLEDSPSLRGYPSEIIGRCYPSARRNAARQMRMRESVFPERCPFGIGEILDHAWLP
jgi:Domain of unknown function DUF29